MRAIAVFTVAAGLAAGSATTDFNWAIKTQTAGYNVSCVKNGASCANGYATCCYGYACTPTVNTTTGALEPRCAVKEDVACVSLGNECSVDAQCCSGGCGKGSADATTLTCINTTLATAAPTTAAPTPASDDAPYEYYYQYDDEGPPLNANPHGSDDSSPHWSAVGASVPIAAVILIIAILTAIAAVVLPKYVRAHRSSSNHKLPPSPPPPHDEWVSSGNIVVNQGWMSAFKRESERFEGFAQIDTSANAGRDNRNCDYENDYEAIDAIEMSELVSEQVEHQATY